MLVINALPLNSEFSLFACSVKMDLSLLNNFPLSTGMMLSFSVESTGKTMLPGSGLAAWKASMCGQLSQHGAPAAGTQLLAARASLPGNSPGQS